MTELERAERDTLLDHNTLCRKVAALEQRVNDLTAQLAQHAAAPYPHVRGLVLLDGPDTPDYDVDAQVDGPILDAGLTDAQRERIWQNVKAAVGGDHAA